nr:GNAT family N-acetyltransferase [Streptomyces bathyalis]
MHSRWGRRTVRRGVIEHLMSRCCCWISLDAATGEVTGLASLGAVFGEPGVVDLGLQVADDFHRRGVGTALTRHAARHGLDRGAHTLTAYTDLANTPGPRSAARPGPHPGDAQAGQVEVRLPLRHITTPSTPA